MPKTRMRQECVSRGGHEKITRWAAARARAKSGLTRAGIADAHHERVRVRFWESLAAHPGPLLNMAEVLP